jgi:predicted Zn-dependent protease
MTSDRLRDEDVQFGEWLYNEIIADVHREETGWAPERVQRVAQRLQSHRPPGDRLVPIVLWLRVFTAFAAPGRYIYVSRRLLERCPDDETAALLVAHEIAHHELGHLSAPEWLPLGVRERGGRLLASIYANITHQLHGPERECDADRHALELCLRAGYDGWKCLELFGVLERYAAEVGDDDIIYGPDPESDNELAPDASFATRARIWLWQRTRGYLPIRDRRAELVRYLEQRGQRSSDTRAL